MRTGQAARKKAPESVPFIGRSWQKENGPPQGKAFFWQTADMLGSPAWRAMAGQTAGVARQVIDRILLEHMNHGGKDNGNLIVTYDDFARYGVRRNAIRPAVEIAAALGWILITEQGRGGNADFRRASRYGLAWLPTVDGSLAVNGWQAIATDEDAQAIVNRVLRSLQKERSTKAAVRCKPSSLKALSPKI